MTTEIRNATIRSTFLGIEDHGFLSHFINLDYGGSGQGWGGFVLGTPKGKSTGLTEDLLIHCLSVVGAEKWEVLSGKPCRVLRHNGFAVALGNYLDDRWVWLADDGIHGGTEQEARESLGATR